MSRSNLRHQRDQDQLAYRMSEWMRAVTSPTPYRVGNSLTINTYRLAQCAIAMLLLLTAAVLLIPVFFFSPSNVNIATTERYKHAPPYNNTYPLSPVVKSTPHETTYHIAIVSDLDTKSKTDQHTWISYLKFGKLTVSKDFRSVRIEWDDEVVLKSDISQKGRGMELSELVAFNGKLYTCDDRSGIVFEITRDWKVLPFVVLNDGDGKQSKGDLKSVAVMKCASVTCNVVLL
jgi:Apyrase